MPEIARTAYGVLQFEGNELIVRSLNADPPKVRLEAPEGSLHKGLVTFGTRRQDGRFEEIVLLAGKQDERSRSNPYDFTGEVTISLRKFDPTKPDDQQFHEVALLRHDGISFRVPITLGRIALRSVANGQFVCAENGGSSPLIANRAAHGPWEQFDVVAIPGS